MSRNGLLLALAMIVSTIAATAGNGPNVMAAPSPSNSIVGAWIGYPAGEPGRAPGSPSLYSYSSDGTVLLTASTPGSKTGQGVWVRMSDHTVAVTIYVIFRNKDDQFIGTAKVRYALKLNSTYDEYTGAAKRELYDAQGKLQQSSDLTVRATRIKLESL